MDHDELGLVPLPDSAPDWAAERDADPNYEALSAEISRMSSMTESGASPPDWKLVVTNGSEILAAKAKDIQIASYVAVGMVHRDDLPGLSCGIKILGDILAVHSDIAFPPKKRKRARINAIQYWIDHASEWMESLPSREMEFDFAEELKKRMASLDDALAVAFEDEAPMLAGLKTLIGRIPVKEPPKPEPAETPDAPEETVVETVESQPAAAPRSAAQAALDNRAAAGQDPEAARKSVASLLADAAQAGEGIAAASTSDPLPYRLRRWAAWSGVRKAPPAEDGRTMLPAPEPYVMQGMDSLLEAGDHAAALKMAEEQISVSLFWLDPQRVAATALAALGPSHQAALNAVKEEALSYVGRLPSLTRLAFTDGTPFADARTKTWLAGLADDGGGGGGAESNPAVAEALEKAKGQAAVNPEEALGTLVDAGRSAGHPRDALLLRIEVLKVFSGAGRVEAARAQISALLETLDRHALDAWEPGLAAQALTAAIACLSAEDDADLLVKLRQRLARTAPAQYFRSE